MQTQTYDFDTVVDRHGTDSLKFDFGMARVGREDLLPLWVADMDFRLPQELLAPLHARIDHGIFGYTDPGERYGEVLRAWFMRRYGWEIDPAWNTVTPGVVYAIATAIRACTRPGEAVLIQRPVYYPFRQTIEDNGRVCVNSPLLYDRESGRYRMDLADLEQKLVEHRVRLLLLCSPHNPVGRVWTARELTELGELCARHEVIVFADEIHCDFIYPGRRFTPFAALGEAFAERVIVGTSPSKSFNLAGLQTANILIPNEALRRRFRKENAASGYSQANTLGLVAAQTVYERGEPWLMALLGYLADNLAYLRNFLRERLPRVRLIEPEGTYLVFLDFADLFDDRETMERAIRERARLWLDEGALFGAESALFMRINIATPRSVLEEACERLYLALSINNGTFDSYRCII